MIRSELLEVMKVLLNHYFGRKKSREELLEAVIQRYNPEPRIATVNILNVRCLLWNILFLITTAAVTDASGASKKVSSGLTPMVVAIVIAVILFVVILLFCCKFCAKKRLKSVNVQDPETGNYSIDILLQVTGNFSDENILGKGGYGVVYKGELHDGSKIAVKRMEVGLISTKRLKAFQNEVDTLTNVRHRHLVQLLGNCVHGDERLLVYEYMSQGTLSQHLFECPEQKTTLCWKQRASIALDVARGIEYLHGLAQEIFIHRDLKPSNILLDDAMRAKVSDFGLVKKAPNSEGNFSFDSKLTGTVGYLSPEYTATGIATTKVDIYAFGVVLMELITGRKALDLTMPEDSIQLVECFHRRVLIARDNILKAIDKTLDIDDEETVESICKVAELAGHCTEREPEKRPDMGYVVNVLAPLVEEWASRSTLTS